MSGNIENNSGNDCLVEAKIVDSSAYLAEAVEAKQLIVVKEVETIEMYFQKIIWKAAQKGAAIAVFLHNWDILIGTPVFYSDDDHSDLPNGSGFFHFDIYLLNSIRWDDHIGGRRKNIFISSIKSIKEMTDAEFEDSRQYRNMAPEFARRLNMSTF